MFHNLEYANLFARMSFITPFLEDKLRAGWRLWGEQTPFCQNFVEIWDWEALPNTELWIAHPDLIRSGEDIDYILDVLIHKDFAGVMGNLCSLGGLFDYYLPTNMAQDVTQALREMRK